MFQQGANVFYNKVFYKKVILGSLKREESSGTKF